MIEKRKVETKKFFKGKLKDLSEWVKGFYLFYNGEHIIIETSEKYVFYTRINKDTLCQYIGITDKNDNMIWENDIVKWKDKLYKVAFYESICSYVLVSSTGHWFHMEMNYGDKLECYDYEVVGNIFDNPELLNL